MTERLRTTSRKGFMIYLRLQVGKLRHKLQHEICLMVTMNLAVEKGREC